MNACLRTFWRGMKMRKIHYSFFIVLAIIAIFYCSKLTASASSADETSSVFAGQVSEFFGLQSAPVALSIGGVPVSLPVASASPGDVVTIPVTIGDITGLNVNSFDCNLTYDPAILAPAAVPYDTAGTLSSTMLVTPNATFPGNLIISAFQSTFLSGSGTLINLKFNVVGTLGGQFTPLAFEDYTDPNMTFHPGFAFNEGDPAATLTNGSFTVAGPTPTSTNTATQTPTFTPSNTATDTPTNTPTFTPTNTATSTPSASPLNTPEPTLGIYPPTSIALSDNVTITPDAPPTDTTSISVETATGFVGELTADPVTGVIRVTNAHHANIIPGTYTVKVKAFGGGGTTTTTFSMTVTNGIGCLGIPGIMSPAVPEVGVNDSPRSIAIGDFNNDGIQDVAAANYISSNVSIRLGDGSGGFTSSAVPEVAVGAFPRSVAVADFNNDGKQDIATTGFALGYVSIRLGDGSGGFTSPAVPEVQVDKGPYSIAIADFNGDGLADFATADSASVSVSIRLGDGNGGFAPAAMPSVGVDGSPRSIAIADFNNDGKQDFATANSVSSNVSIRLGDGTGGFLSPLQGEVELGFGNNPRSVAIGDFNGDGKQDFAAANFNSNSVSIGLGNGSGGFAPPAAPLVTVGNAPQAVAIGDFNNDGYQDFATAGSAASTVSLRFGNGSGGFTSPSYSEVNVGTTPLAVAIGDLNGDGIQDFVTANDGSDNVSIRLAACAPFTLEGTVRYGNAQGVPTPPRFVSNVTMTTAGQATVITTTGAPGPTAGQYVLNLFGPGPYTVTPSKPFAFDSAINSFDAARVAVHVSGISLLTGNALVAADVTGNSQIQSFDAAQIARYVANIPPFGQTGTWKFFTIPNIPFPIGTTPTSRTYPTFDSSITGQDYTGLLIGDVSGNWQNTGARPVNNGPVRGVTVNIPSLVTAADKEVVIPVSVQGAANKGIVSYEFELRYDPSVIQPLPDAVDVSGTVSRGLYVVTNAKEPGILRVVVYGPMPIDKDGVLLNLRFAAVGADGQVSALTFGRIMFNEGEPRVMVTDGQVAVTAASE